jgi:Cu-processing system permease protein
VIVITGLFALLAVGISAYGRSSGDAAEVVTAPSLVTLSTFLVPLVALILGHDAIVGERERHTLGLLLSLPIRRSELLLAKYVGRVLALCGSIGLGLGSASLMLDPGQRAVVLWLVPHTLALGASFLSVGVLISVAARRLATAASMAVVVWFLLVFIYDLALLALMVLTDGAVGQQLVTWLVMLNPAGLFRVQLMTALVGQDALAELGLTVAIPGAVVRTAIWATWIVAPLVIGALLLGRRQAVTA